jgi:hypothetical protein
MAFRFNTKVRDDMLGKKAECNALLYSAAGIALVEGGAGTDSITLAAGLSVFEVGDMITVALATDGDDDGTYEAIAVTDTVITLPIGSFTTGQAAGTPVNLGSARGGSLIDQFRNATMVIRTASQPTSADDAETGSELIQITESSGAFVADSPGNGINFGQVASAELHAASGEVWSGVAGATGTAGHFRIYANDMTTGATTTEARIDGAIATSGSQMNMANTSITSGGTTTIDDVDIPMAESA